MSELEQRLAKELSKQAEQYEQDQKRLAGQVERLEEQVTEIGRAIRTGSEAVGRAGTAVGRAASDRSERVYRVEQAHGRASGQLQRICQHLGREIQRNDPAYGKAVAVICPNIEQLRIERGRDERIRLGDERGRGRDRDSGPSISDHAALPRNLRIWRACRP